METVARAVLTASGSVDANARKESGELPDKLDEKHAGGCRYRLYIEHTASVPGEPVKRKRLVRTQRAVYKGSGKSRISLKDRPRTRGGGGTLGAPRFVERNYRRRRHLVPSLVFAPPAYLFPVSPLSVPRVDFYRTLDVVFLFFS